MRIATAVLADATNVRENLLNVLSAGVSYTKYPEFPAPCNVDLALLLELGESDLELDRVITINMQVFAPDGSELAELEGELGWSKSEIWPQYAPAPISLHPVQLPGPGRYTIRVQVADLEEIVLTLRAEELEAAT